jgi:hypothetical protein
MDSPLPCPYCDTLSALVRIDDNGTDAWVYCDRCAACGPTKPTADEAVAAWNRVAVCVPSEPRRHDAIHSWFELSYAQYLTIPRSVLQSMPGSWQQRFVACLEQLDALIDWRPHGGRYWVELRDAQGRYARDPLMDYERGRRRIPLRNEAAE